MDHINIAEFENVTQLNIKHPVEMILTAKTSKVALINIVKLLSKIRNFASVFIPP